MFIASISLNNLRAPAGAQCALVCSLYIPLRTERDNSVGEGYKHRAPPEQGLKQQKTELFVQSRLDLNRSLHGSGVRGFWIR